MASPAFCQIGSSSHDTVTSTGTTDEQTLTPPASAVACLVTVETTSARATFDATTPSATNGIVLPKDAAPLSLPFAAPIHVVSTAGASSIVSVVWLF